MENELVFGILTRDGVLWLALGMFAFVCVIITYAVIAPTIPTLIGDKKSKIAKGAKGSEA